MIRKQRSVVIGTDFVLMLKQIKTLGKVEVMV